MMRGGGGLYVCVKEREVSLQEKILLAICNFYMITFHTFSCVSISLYLMIEF